MQGIAHCLHTRARGLLWVSVKGGLRANFFCDAVIGGLRVNANLHNPFLCVTDISDIASGDLSLSGVMGR